MDPLYAVARCKGKEKAGEAPWKEAEFYEMGRLDWDQFLACWERYGLDKTSCVEIGCGAGRITLQLANCFQAVHALDVSEGMLAYARRKVTQSSARFYLTAGTEIPLPDTSVTAAFSTLVFQHFDSTEHGFRYFKEVSRVLKPRGTLMVQLPVHAWPAIPKVFEAAYAVRKRIDDVKAQARRWLVARGWRGPGMRIVSYRSWEVFARLPTLGLADVSLLTLLPRSSREQLYSFVLARRS